MRSGKPGKATFFRKVTVPALMLGMSWATFCPATLAQEAVGQGWGAAEPSRRPSNAISLPATGRNEIEAKSLPPFPVLMPEAIIYPRKAVQRKWEGQTIVAAEVLPDGSVGRTALSRSSGHEVLDQAAREAIQSWKFEAESEKDEDVPQYVDIPVTFKLQDEGR